MVDADLPTCRKRTNKKSPEGPFQLNEIAAQYLSGCLCNFFAHAPDGTHEIALDARSEVLVNDTLVGDAVDDRLGFLHLLLRCGLVACENSLLHFFHCGAKLRAERGVVGALFVVLTGTFFSLSGICHGECFLCIESGEPAILRSKFQSCNSPALI